MTASQTTTLRPAWRWRMLFIFVLFAGFGTWGLYDALVAYPARGARYAEYREQQYLRSALEASGRARLRPEDVKIMLPGERLADLESRVADGTSLSERESNELNWLKGLRVIGALSADNTTYDAEGDREPNGRLAELTAEWETRNPPKPLHAFDIAIQWIIFVVGWAVGLYAAGLVAMVATRKYRFDPETRTLTLPTGESIAPDDLEDVDKRRWHKFYVHLKIAKDHPKLGGREIPIDLFRRDKLEGWILEMERQRFPDRAEEAPPENADDDAKSPEPEHSDAG